MKDPVGTALVTDHVHRTTRKRMSPSDKIRLEARSLARLREEADRKTRFWQFGTRRKRKALRKELAERERRLNLIRERLALSEPFNRAFKGILPRADREQTARNAQRRFVARMEAEQQRAKDEADRLLAEMDAEEAAA